MLQTTCAPTWFELQESPRIVLSRDQGLSWNVATWVGLEKERSGCVSVLNYVRDPDFHKHFFLVLFLGGWGVVLFSSHTRRNFGRGEGGMATRPLKGLSLNSIP